MLIFSFLPSFALYGLRNPFFSSLSREFAQFSTEELVKEVESSITEFKRHKQEYDEERVREQVRVFITVI